MHWSRKCRCSGVPGTEGMGWCGNGAEEEDGLCSSCREVCVALGGAYVLSMVEVQVREPAWFRISMNQQGDA